MPSKTTITVSAKTRAAYAAMQVDYPGLSLTDFYDQAVTFFLAYRDEASFRPTLRHLTTITQQLDTLTRQLQTVTHPPPINHDHLAQLLAKHVVDALTKVPPPLVLPGVRGWLLRRWQKRYGDIRDSSAHTQRYRGHR
jgi:hypothetical protein